MNNLMVRPTDSPPMTPTGTIYTRGMQTRRDPDSARAALIQTERGAYLQSIGYPGSGRATSSVGVHSKSVKKALGITGTGSPTVNPLSDVPNWSTGGRTTSAAASGTDPAKMWLWIGGAFLLFLVMKK